MRMRLPQDIQKPAYDAYGASSRRFFCYHVNFSKPISYERGKEINSDLSSMGSMINCGLAFDFAILASLSEGGGSPPLLRQDGRSVALFGAETAPNRARGKSRGRT